MAIIEIETKVEMKRGGFLPCLVKAHVSDDFIDDLILFWIPKKGKLYPINKSLIKSTDKPEEDLSIAFLSQNSDPD